MNIEVRDVEDEEVDDVFEICSHGRLEDPIQRLGIELKRKWMLEMLDAYGPTAKIAYLDHRPVAQILFYPEEAVPYIENPRRDAVILNCIYNPFPEARGKGCGTLLVRSLIEECSRGLRSLRGRPCSFIVAHPFNTGEGASQEEFYSSRGFRRAQAEMYMEVNAPYQPREGRDYNPLPEDRDRALVFYNPICEWSYPFALRMEERLRGIEPNLRIEMIDSWRRPEESLRRGNPWLVVNSTTIKSFVLDGDAFHREVLEALKKTEHR
jgi:GNAT superfamily N-acetyltransferase